MSYVDYFLIRFARYRFKLLVLRLDILIFSKYMSHALVLCGSEVSKSKGGASSIRSQLSKKNTLPSVESKPNTDDILHACAPSFSTFS